MSIIRLEGEPAVRVAGELDAYTAPALEAALLGNGGDIPVRLDLSEVSFIDSTGIRVIVKADNDEHLEIETAR